MGVVLAALGAATLAAGPGFASGAVVKRPPLPRMPASSYTCVAQPKDAPAPPPLPASAAADRAAAPLASTKPLCPDGQIPVSHYVNGDLPPWVGAGDVNRSSTPNCEPISVAGAYYCHQAEAQFPPLSEQTVGVFANLSVHAPSVANGSHTLAQIWAVDSTTGGSQGTTEEIGWTVDPSLNGDANPHLFIYHFDGGAETCYNGCGFIPAAGTPTGAGQTIPPDGRIVKFGAQRFGTDWWFYYAGFWIGSIPQSAFTHFNQYVDRASAGGEVAAFTWAPCTDMGNGAWGSLGGALVDHGYRVRANGSVSFLGEWFGQEGNAYNMGFVDPSTGSFRYGGPGWC